MKRVIIGQRGADYGLWISKPGKDASSTTDSDMLVSPSRFLVQPYMQGRIYAPSTGGYNGINSSTSVNFTVTHNLGYIPVIEIFGTIANNVFNLQATVTTTKLIFNGTSGYAADITYVIFLTELASS